MPANLLVSKGFQQFYKVADIFLKSPDVASLPQILQEILRIEHWEMLFPVFLELKNQFPRQGRSSLDFSLKRM